MDMLKALQNTWIHQLWNLLVPSVKAHESQERERIAKVGAFPQWRPTFHLMAPSGWMNDPCGLGYDPKTRRYHISFQWNPRGNDWGNMSWGHSTSTDFVSWNTSPIPHLIPDMPYDHCGVFTGCLRTTDIHGQRDGSLTYIYTSVSKLPIHYTLPYNYGSESLSLAVSDDGGKKWKKPALNPILPGPPQGMKVTGWRDPFVAPWPSLSKFINASETDIIYGCISGGIVDETPTTFLYSIDSKDLSRWNFLGPLVHVGLNRRLSRWSGDLGLNWEVTNFLTLADGDSEPIEVLIMGAEGCLPKQSCQTDNSDSGMLRRTPRGQLWMSGSFRKPSQPSSGPVELTYDFGGIFDHGSFYAANSFWDPVTKQHIVTGWVTEEDLPDQLRHRQGWSGCLSVARVLSLQTIPQVSKARGVALREITSIQLTPDEHGTFTIRTLGIKPDPRLKKLQHKSRKLELPSTKLYPLTSDRAPNSGSFLDVKTLQWEFLCDISIGKSSTRVGVCIAHTRDFACNTILSFEASSSTFLIRRSSASGPCINTSPESASHTLFSTIDPVTNVEREEMLRIHAFFDQSVLEVFVNDRTVITTRVYAQSDRCFGISVFAEGEGSDAEAAVLKKCVVWDGIRA